MPQMAPSMWSTLLLMFLMSHMTYMTLIYFFTIYNPKKCENKKMLNKTNNWKW